jgi:hypothetical protein
MYVELGMRTRHVVQGSGTMSFHSFLSKKNRFINDIDQNANLIYKADIDLYRSKLKPISSSYIDLSNEQTITFKQLQKQRTTDLNNRKLNRSLTL